MGVQWGLQHLLSYFGPFTQEPHVEGVPGFVLVLEGWNVLMRKEPLGPGFEWSLSVAVGEPEQCLSDPGRQLL